MATNKKSSIPEPTVNDLKSQDEFLRLMQDCNGILHKICQLYASTPIDREDLFQEIVVQLWKAWPGFRGESKFSTWLYRIALNTAITGIRKKSRMVILDFPATIPREEADHSEARDKEERLQDLYRAIARLSEIDRAIVMLYLDDRSYEEMEEIMGMNQNNLRVKMNRIKEKLRQLTKNSGHGTG